MAVARHIYIPAYMMTLRSRFAIFLFFACFGYTTLVSAQDNYEIQVYGSDTVPPRTTMVEIHSNFTFEGSKTVQDGMLPTNHAEHEANRDPTSVSHRGDPGCMDGKGSGALGEDQ